MSKEKRLIEHARHNIDVCTHLQKSNDFNDWVITTAFYAAMYYVYYELFPEQFEVDGKLVYCHNFSDYYNKLWKNRGNKHSVTEDLVNEHLPEIYTSYSTLREMCHTARYFNYVISPVKVKLALECLEEIKKYCEPVELNPMQ